MGSPSTEVLSNGNTLQSNDNPQEIDLGGNETVALTPTLIRGETTQEVLDKVTSLRLSSGQDNAPATYLSVDGKVIAIVEIYKQLN